MLLDVGHANVVAGYMGVETATLIEPVLDAVSLFHVHDNLGARLHGEGGPTIDPLQLDLHLPPGGGNVPWDQIRVALTEPRRTADDGDTSGPPVGPQRAVGGRDVGHRRNRNTGRPSEPSAGAGSPRGSRNSFTSAASDRRYRLHRS